MPGIVFDELPEALQQRLAESNPELRAYREALAEGPQAELEEALARLARAQAERCLAVAKARGRTSPFIKILGFLGSALVIITAHGRI